jgi:hypothetical protein
MCSERQRETDAGINRNDFLAVALLAPHLPTASQDKPDFLHSSMGNRNRGFTRTECKVSDAAGLQAKQQAHLGPVRGNRITCNWKTLCIEITHSAPQERQIPPELVRCELGPGRLGAGFGAGQREQNLVMRLLVADVVGRINSYLESGRAGAVIPFFALVKVWSRPSRNE